MRENKVYIDEKIEQYIAGMDDPFGIKIEYRFLPSKEYGLTSPVLAGEDIYLAGVRNFPNPFNESTFITLKHYGEDGNFDVHLEVYDVTGRLVDAFSQRVSCTNGQIEPIRWDGRNSSGMPLPTGLVE